MTEKKVWSLTGVILSVLCAPEESLAVPQGIGVVLFDAIAIAHKITAL